MALVSKYTKISPQDKARLQQMLDKSQARALELSEKSNQTPSTARPWDQITPEEQQLILLKAVEMTLMGKGLTTPLQQTLPPPIAQSLSDTPKAQNKHRKLGTRSLPQRLQFLVDRLRAKGLLEPSTKQDNPLDRLTPSQRRHQLAAEALELRRQNAVQMTEAIKLLPKGS